MRFGRTAEAEVELPLAEAAELSLAKEAGLSLLREEEEEPTVGARDGSDDVELRPRRPWSSSAACFVESIVMLDRK